MTKSPQTTLELADEAALADFIYEVQNRTDAKEKAKSLWPLLRSPASAPQAGVGTPIEKLAQDVVTRVSEYDDRTSPEDWLEALLITADELHSELMRFAESLLSSAPAAVGMDAREVYQATLCDDGQWMVHTEGDILAYAAQGNSEQKATAIRDAMNAAVPQAESTPPAGGEPVAWQKAVADSTVSCSGLEITIQCDSRDDKDALMDFLVDAAYATPQAQAPAWQSDARPSAETAVGQYEFPYQRTFDAIAAATSIYAEGIGINVSVKKFQEAFNNHRDSAVLSALTVQAPEGMREAYEIARHIVGHLEANCGLSFLDVKQTDWQAITNLVAPLAASPRSPGEWQTIETAPKDGTAIDLFSTSGKRWCNYRWDRDFPHGAWSDATTKNRDWRDRPFMYAEQATHWQPLPAAPSQEVQG